MRECKVSCKVSRKVGNGEPQRHLIDGPPRTRPQGASTGVVTLGRQICSTHLVPSAIPSEPSLLVAVAAQPESARSPHSRRADAPAARFLLRCPSESCPQPLSVNRGTPQIDRVDLPCVGNVVQRVRIEDDEVRTLARYDRADVVDLQ